MGVHETVKSVFLFCLLSSVAFNASLGQSTLTMDDQEEILELQNSTSENPNSLYIPNGSKVTEEMSSSRRKSALLPSSVPAQQTLSSREGKNMETLATVKCIIVFSLLLGVAFKAALCQSNTTLDKQEDGLKANSSPLDKNTEENPGQVFYLSFIQPIPPSCPPGQTYDAEANKCRVES